LELIEIAGGKDVFPELRKQKAAKDRIVSPHDVIAAALSHWPRIGDFRADLARRRVS
jgi:hypothetical protein